MSELDPGGIEPLEAFREALLKENRMLKRALTDPRICSGIGNAHSDESLLKGMPLTGQEDVAARRRGDPAALRGDPQLPC